MATYGLQLLSFPGKYKGKEAPYGPRAYVALKRPEVEEFAVKGDKEKAEFYLITPDCVAFQEFDAQVNRLIEELETIRKKGKKILRKG
jgi:hypothetical protein